jgi:hypothetical protein
MSACTVSLSFVSFQASVAQPGRAPPCQGGRRGFKSLRSLHFHFRNLVKPVDPVLKSQA